MTLHRGSLLPPTSLADIAILALSGQGAYGTVAQIAREHALTRQSVYRLRDAGHQALLDTFSSETPASWNPDVPEATLKRSIVGLYTIAPCSIDDIVDLLPILFPGTTRSHGYIFNVLQEAQQNAAALLDNIDLSAIDAVAIDEMFWHQTPIFTGIDLDTGFLFSAEAVRHCTGPEWVSHLHTLHKQQALQPGVIVKDAGTAMAEAATVVWPEAEQRDDLFHALYHLNNTARFLNNAAYRAIKSVDDIDKKLQRAKGRAARDKLRKLRRESAARMEESIKRFDTFEEIKEAVEQVLRLCDPGRHQIRTAQDVRRRLPPLADRLERLGDKHAAKVGRYLRNRVEGLCSYLDRLSDELALCAKRVGHEALVPAMVRAYQANLLAGRGPRWHREVCQAELTEAVRDCLVLCDDAEHFAVVMAEVVPVLEKRHRASSAIENVHSVLRPYITVHKRVSQGFLDLFRFYWNTRVRRWGRHNGTSALHRLTGAKHDEWLTMLGYPPA